MVITRKYPFLFFIAKKFLVSEVSNLNSFSDHTEGDRLQIGSLSSAREDRPLFHQLFHFSFHSII